MRKPGLKKCRILFIMALALCMVVVLVGCGDKGGSVSEKESYVNPLTGKVSDAPVEAARPLVVSIDNVGDAIPQSWISKADVVYEFPVEGKQTRLQAIYYSQFPEEFGPIRSTRPYFVDLAREYKAVFLAHGWSPQAMEYLLTDVVPYINAMNSDCEFYRVDDKEAPHDSYIKWSEVKSKIDEQGWWNENQDVRAFKFLEKGEDAAGEATVDVAFNYSGSGCQFVYDEASKKYTRMVNGAKYIDKETGKAIKVSNILVQRVASSVLDEKGRLSIDMCAGGEAMLFTGGKVVKGTWSRENLDSKTVFVDADGNEFKLSAGKTWVEIADQNCDIVYEIIEETEEQ